MALEEGRASLSTFSNANKENAESINAEKKNNMKTVAQRINKVCPPLISTQNKASIGLEPNKAPAARPMSTKSPIAGRTLKPAKRKGLATLQPSASSKNAVVGGFRKGESSHGELKQTKFEIFTEKTSKKAVSCSRVSSKAAVASKSVTTTIATQTDFEEWLSLEEMHKKDPLAEEALALMRTEPSQEEYYKYIAEERRLALEETLQENEELFDELDKLKKKCTSLEKALSEAEEYKLLYISMLEREQESTQTDASFLVGNSGQKHL